MSVSGVLSQVSTVIGTVVDIIGGNSVLSALLGLSIVGVGAMVFKKLLAR